MTLVNLHYIRSVSCVLLFDVLNVIDTCVYNYFLRFFFLKSLNLLEG